MSEEVKSPSQMLGMKFYRYDEVGKHVEIVRVAKEQVNAKHEIEIVDDESGKKRLLPESILTTQYTKLIPDGFAIFSIIKVVDHKDVCVALFRQSDILCSGMATPYAVCRQAIHDIFSEVGRRGSMLPVVGMSISQDTCPSNVKFTDILAADEMVFTRRMAIYQEDDIDTILRILPTRKYDQVLREYKMIEDGNYLGLCDTLKDLLQGNQFMSDFNRAFNIKEVPFDPTPDEDGRLPLEDISFISGELKCNIIETYVMEYSKYLDEEAIVRSHIKVVGPGKRKIWVVGYDVAEGEYHSPDKVNT